MSDRLGTSRTPTLAELLQLAMEQRLADLHVAMPGIVEKYDPILQTVDVKPLLKRAVIFDDGSETSEAYPILPSVPVMFPRGGGYFLSFPLTKGDQVLLIFIERSIDNFVFSSGNIAINPIDFRKHDLSDAVAFPCFYPVPKGLKDEIISSAVFGKELGTQLRATGTTMEVTTLGAPTASDFVAMAAKIDLIITLIHGVFMGWVPVPQDGGAALKTLWLSTFGTPPISPSAASLNLKAD